MKIKLVIIWKSYSTAYLAAKYTMCKCTQCRRSWGCSRIP